MADRDEEPDVRRDEPGDATLKRGASEAKSELLAALGHLKNAAQILFGAADPAVRKAAAEVERMLHRIGSEAEPIAQKLSAELSNMTRSIVEAIEGKKSEPPPQDGKTKVDPAEPDR
jgi:hypothetical protein